MDVSRTQQQICLPKLSGKPMSNEEILVNKYQKHIKHKIISKLVDMSHEQRTCAHFNFKVQ